MTHVLVCGGGSGGHVYPALALLEALRRHPETGRLGFVGTKRGLEARVFAGRRDVSFFPIHARHFRGSFSHNVRALGALGLGCAEALNLIRKFRPGLILGTGGYSAFPVMAAGIGLGVPTVALEPNAVLGTVNRVLAPYVDRLFYNEPEAVRGRDLPHAVRTGVPLRHRLWAVERSEALYRRWGLDPDKRTLLVLGGSLGSRALREAALGLANRLPDCQILMSLGTRGSEAPGPMRAHPHVRVVPYIDRMDEALALADAALCRAGAVTLAELSACGLPALAVPWEGAAGAHQLHNARRYAESGAGLMMRERDITENAALEALARLLAPGPWSSMHCIGFALGGLHRKAGARIMKEVEPYLEGNVSLRRHRWRRHERAGQGVLAAASPAPRVQHRAQSPHL